MWLSNKILKEDLEYLLALDCINWGQFRDKTILITGATGLIGFNLISGLVYADLKKELGLKILALVRDYNKAVEKFAEHLRDSKCLEFLVGDVVSMPQVQGGIDYIIHTASPTASLFFIEKPVETIKIAVMGTNNILDMACRKRVKGVVYTSSMEVYGAPKTEDVLSEENLGYMNPLLVRNCYPESKRQCEALCAAYASEYQVPAMSVRLAQTFGVGIDKEDGRVFAEFARCAVEKKNIVLLTDGSSKRCYLYTMDAVSAILTVLLNGEPGTAYNAANPNTYCSVREMADLVAEELGQKKIMVEVSENEESSKKFPPPHFYNLGIERITELGWKPSRDLIQMYQRMIESE